MTRLLLLGLNYAPEEVGIGLYSGELIESWVAAGHQATVVTAVPYYPQWSSWEGFPSGWSSEMRGEAKVIRCPIYVPSSPTGLRRLIHHMTFSASSFFPMLWQALRHRPEIVLTVAPSLVAAPIAWLAAKVVGARSWLHIQDFEVEAAAATGLIKPGSLGVRTAMRLERAIFRLFDTVSSISPQMCRKLVDKGIDQGRIAELPNWADLEQVQPIQGESPFRRRWGIGTAHVALYSGTLANKQGIEIVLEAARLLGHRKDLTFVICGEGPTRTMLEHAAAYIPNVQVRGLQSRENLSDLLGLASVHLLPQRGAAVDVALPSKLLNVLASGRPIIATAAPGTGLHDAVDGVGITTPPDDAQRFASSIDELLSDPGQMELLGERARRRAEECWSRPAIVGQFIALALQHTKELN